MAGPWPNHYKTADTIASMMDYTLLASIGLEETLFTKKTISAQEVSLPENNIIYQSGDPCGAFLLLVEGQVRVEMTSKSGREIILYRMYEKQTCIITTSVLLNHENYYARAVTETPIKAIAISSDDFYTALDQSNRFAHYILKGYSERMTSLIGLLDKIASKDIEFELACLLANKMDASNITHMTQEAMAKELGTAREVISRKLSQLEDQGVLVTHRGKVEIINPHKIHNKIS